MCRVLGVVSTSCRPAGPAHTALIAAVPLDYLCLSSTCSAAVYHNIYWGSPGDCRLPHTKPSPEPGRCPGKDEQGTPARSHPGVNGKGRRLLGTPAAAAIN